MKDFSLGLDFGSNSARALVIENATGKEFGVGVRTYAGGAEGVITSEHERDLARQEPQAYLDAMVEATRQALAAAAQHPGFDAAQITGIGVDTTGSTPLPVDARNQPLSNLPRFKDNLNAKAWMWKDHTSTAEALAITAAAAKTRPQYLRKCGGAYSSEWFWAKIWRCLNAAPEVFDAAASWVEFCDFIPATLAGIADPAKIKRSVCAAGHKAMFNASWGGLPDAEFLGSLHPKLAALRGHLYEHAHPAGEIAGRLCPAWADKLGLKAGTAISVGAFDAHLGAVGAGVKQGSLAKIVGTSTCDIMVAPLADQVPDIEGVCGIVAESVLPGHHGIEAGQSAVGDIFKWFAVEVLHEDVSVLPKMESEAAKLLPGESGLLALDWENGNRCVLVDQRLSGLILGLNLRTGREKIYRALLEATAFGARKIIDQLAASGVEIHALICCGGIAEKSALFNQLYADILNRDIKISGSSQTCALGAAMAGAVAAGSFASFAPAQERFCAFKDKVYKPIPARVAVYDRLYALYSELHDGFGRKGSHFDHYNVMKDLLAIQDDALKAKRGR